VLILFALPWRAGAAHASTDDTRLLTALDGTGSGVQETSLGDLVADSAASTGHVQIAFVPADELTPTTLPVGYVDADKVVDTLSYYGDTTDTVQVLNLTGEQVVKAITRSVSRLPQAYPGFLQVSGIKVTEEKGSLVVTLADGAALDPNATYKVAMTAPLAAGELGYFSIWGSQAKAKDSGVPIAQALRTYLGDNHDITEILGNRIIEH